MRLKKTYFFILFTFIIFSSNILFCEKYLDKEILDVINASVFEVVILKPTKDSLTYEKPLPLDLIPFHIRNDKYYSIGTAFAISESKFLSASHVFGLDNESQYDKIFIRNKEGNVYEIDEIHKFSDHKDFILFTSKGITVDKILNINLEPNMNENVFAVGNAYGEGIIIRDGVLTSKTPEEENGEWKWYRYSAAASPGNSGGPLLDKDGNVIGIITRKSRNENLNYALPISVFNESEKNIAISHKKIKYSLANTYKVKQTTYDFKTNLPKDYQNLKVELIDKYNMFCQQTLDALLDENKDNFFPNGKVSLNLLHNTYNAVFPHLIAEGEDGNWNAFHPKETNSGELDNNGYVSYGSMLGIDFVYLRKPDDITLKEICENSKLFMDLILKGNTYNRQVQNEKIKITSLGEANEEYDFIDDYKRKWMVKTWLIEYSDYKLVSFSLIVPEGVITLFNLAQTGYMNSGLLPDLKVLVNFIYLSYYGTFKQWHEFFQNKKYLPEFFSTIEFSFNKNKSVSFKSKRLSFLYKPDFLEISEDSDLTLYFTYIKENKKVVWDINGITVGESKKNSNYFSIFKKLNPEEGLNEVYFNVWEKIYKQEYPYNNISNFDEGNTYIQSVHNKYANLKKMNEITNDFIYILELGLEGKVSNNKIKKKLKIINSAITLFE
ncbi:MAG: trypsin-like peptidase domain-containing protein [Spirochaetes bacterium]|nr:trypsin-like peptidase domain-containing protein [Spirochaetota bacterium]